jgi:hypothetical protein
MNSEWCFYSKFFLYAIENYTHPLYAIKNFVCYWKSYPLCAIEILFSIPSLPFHVRALHPARLKLTVKFNGMAYKQFCLFYYRESNSRPAGGPTTALGGRSRESAAALVGLLV